MKSSRDSSTSTVDDDYHGRVAYQNEEDGHHTTTDGDGELLLDTYWHWQRYTLPSDPSNPSPYPPTHNAALHSKRITKEHTNLQPAYEGAQASDGHSGCDTRQRFGKS
ncbi:hypothetical protein Vi05172_g7362 [Venturia inaequalis]|nr:hypothetical protein Vi05172_g7362 [Venturia inaequalis]